MLPISLMKGDEVVEGGEELANPALLCLVNRHRQLGFEKVRRGYVEQPMVPRAFRGNRLYALIPAICFVVRDEELRVDAQSLENDI